MVAPASNFPTAVGAYLQAAQLARPPLPMGQDGSDHGGGFAAVVQAAVAPVVRAQNEAKRHIEMFNNGDEPEIHETMLALEKANIVFKLGLSFRDKAVEAFERCLQAGNG